ncbi:peroxin [Phlyctochytrium planicorne]|nr:peroxin [Phlyctochytrium planicorne]
MEVIGGFFQRNRQRFAIAGGIVGGCYLVYKYAEFKWKEMEASREMERTAKANVKLRFEQNQKDCTFAVLRLLPTLDQLYPALDVEAITGWLQQVKSGAITAQSPEALKAQRIEKWKELKIISFTRTIAALYLVNLLTVFTFIQLNLLGRFIYLDSVAASGKLTDDQDFEDRKGLSFETEQQYLTFSWFLLNVGWNNCVARVRNAVEEVIGVLPLEHNLTYPVLLDLIEKIRTRVEYNDPAKTKPFKFSDLLLPPEGQEMSVLAESFFEDVDASKLKMDDQLKKLLDETRDFLDSPDFPSVLTASFDQSFDILHQTLHPFFYEPKTESGITPITDAQAQQPLIPVDAEGGKIIKLAFAVGFVAQQTDLFIKSNPNVLVDALSTLPEVKGFSAIVYTGWDEE